MPLHVSSCGRTANPGKASHLSQAQHYSLDVTLGRHLRLQLHGKDLRGCTKQFPLEYVLNSTTACTAHPQCESNAVDICDCRTTA